MQHPEAVILLPPRGDVRAVVHFDFARLRARLPAAAELPRDGRVELLFAAPDTGLAPMSVYFQYANGALVTESNLSSIEGDRVAVEALVPGTYSLTLSLFDAQATAVATPMPDGSVRFERPKPYFHTTKDVVLVAGRTLDVDL